VIDQNAVAAAGHNDRVEQAAIAFQFGPLDGVLVTIDARGCQKEIARKSVDGGGDYLLAVKDKQPHWLADIQESVTTALDSAGSSAEDDTFTTAERGHGRQETRSSIVVTTVESIRQREAWAKLPVVGLCQRERLVNGKQSEQVPYFIGSRVLKAQQCGEALRGHWGIENHWHWQLDVTFNEEANRVQRRHGAENLALVRRLALGLLKQHPGKESLACKRYLAALDTDFLEEILAADRNSEKP
jgi:predicted transposase YbfD/YdcC